MIVPIEDIHPDTLVNLVEAFVLREGTDYGEQEVAFRDKVEQVLGQLKTGEVVILYSELHESVDLVSREQVSRLQQDDDQS